MANKMEIEMTEQEKMLLAASADQHAEAQAPWDFLEEFWGNIETNKEDEIENEKDYMEGELFPVRNDSDNEVTCV